MRYVTVLLLCLLGAAATAQTHVYFDSLDGPPAARLDGYLFDIASVAGAHPAVVLMPGCAGMFTRRGTINPRELEWARRLSEAGYVTMIVDSLRPRHHGEMCAPASFDPEIFRARGLDAYAALRYLQGLPDVQPDHVGIMGWSQGGAVALNVIRATSKVRPALLPQGDFRAAVAFYPGACSPAGQGNRWDSSIPLLLLIGAKDVWTPLEPCERIMRHPARETVVDFQVYPDAYHDFDAPDTPVRELPAFKTSKGVIPIVGTDPQARADAIERVMAFLKQRLP
jgi:dienelactone hydrolase